MYEPQKLTAVLEIADWESNCSDKSVLWKYRVQHGIKKKLIEEKIIKCQPAHFWA